MPLPFCTVMEVRYILTSIIDTQHKTFCVLCLSTSNPSLASQPYFSHERMEKKWRKTKSRIFLFFFTFSICSWEKYSWLARLLKSINYANAVFDAGRFQSTLLSITDYIPSDLCVHIYVDIYIYIYICTHHEDLSS